MEFRNWETVSRATSSVHILNAIAAAIISVSSIWPVRKALASGHLTISSNLIIDTIEHSINVSISKYTLPAEKNDLEEDAAQHGQRIDGLDCRSIPCLSRRR